MRTGSTCSQRRGAERARARRARRPLRQQGQARPAQLRLLGPDRLPCLRLRHQAEHKRLQDRINAKYVDKLDGLVDTAFYEMSNQWRHEQNRCQREIERHQNADKSCRDEGVALLDLARNAQILFAKQEPREKRRLLNFVLSNCTWEDGEVATNVIQPFDIFVEK
jgi:hypothetical protein